MGSSLFQSQATILAWAFGALFLLFDTARYFFFQLGPVRLRRLIGDENGGSRLFRYNPQHFLLITGALLQIAISGGVIFTLISLSSRGAGLALGTTAAIWLAIIIGWKLLLGLVPEELSEVLLRAIVPISHIFYYLFWPVLFPIRWLLVHVEKRDERNEDDDENPTDEEVQAYIDVGEEEGILEEGEGRLIQSIVDFGDRVARELMTPRVDMLAFDAKRPLTELAQLFMESKYSRIPIYEETIDRISGVVHVKEVFDAMLRGDHKPVAELARPAYFVSETKLVSELLREFQLEHIQIAFVVDEYGGTAGLITIEDVIEEIVGEIADEHEEEEDTVVELSDDEWLVNGLVRVEILEDKFGVDIQGDDYETVAGLIFTQIGRVPKVGESVRKNGILLEVERADRKRIYRVRAMRDPEWLLEDESREQRAR